MRIVHISDCYAPRTGGIETQVRSLAWAQAARGDEVHVITATPGHGLVRSGRDSDGPVTIHRVAARLPAELPVHPRTGHHVRILLATLRPDVVHVHTGVVSPFAWSGLRMAAHLTVPRVVTVHSMWGPWSRPAHRYTSWALPWMDPDTEVTAVSQAAARLIEESLHCPVSVLPNGIDPQDWPARPRPVVPGVLRIVSVLRLAPRKRAGALIEIVSRTRVRLEGRVRVSTVLIGGGPQEARLRRRVSALGPSAGITMTGRLSATDIKEAFAGCDLFVQASVRESFGIAALEARTSGVPVVARRQTGAGEFIVDGVNGLLVDDDEAMVEALVALAENPDKLNRMRRFNIENPPRQAWSEVLVRADEVYARAGA